MDEKIAVMTMFITVVGTIAGITRMTLNHIRLQKLARLQADTAAKILDKLGSTPETLEWLRNGDMKRFFDLQVENSSQPHARILNTITAGLILLFLGIGCLSFVSVDPDIVWRMMGTILGALGMGFLISSAASYVLSKKWGLIERNQS